MSRKRRRPLRYPIDPSVKGEFGKLPPKGHAKRCQGTNKYRVQCEKWARKGSMYCKRHGGYNRQYNRPVNWYAREATETLAERLKAMHETSPDKRLSLLDEVDVARELASRAFRVYDKSHYGDKKKDFALQQLAREALQDAINNVSDVVTKAAKAQTLSASVIGVHHIEWMAAQFTKIIEDCVLPHNEQAANLCLKRLGEIELPKAGDTKATAEQLREALREMDESIETTDPALD